MNEPLLLRLRVEELLYREAALLDDWQLKDWLALFSQDARYEIAPTGDAEAEHLDASQALFLVADDRPRLEQRVLRLSKPSAHAEYPHSRVRHLYTNVRAAAAEGGGVTATANFVTFRNKRSVTATYMGKLLYRLSANGDGFLITWKRVVLDLDSLVPQGKVSLIL
jgi:p-cumate 2,3-dioxygenase subunit beta